MEQALRNRKVREALSEYERGNPLSILIRHSPLHLTQSSALHVGKIALACDAHASQHAERLAERKALAWPECHTSSWRRPVLGHA